MGDETILALIEPRSNTMQQGFHQESLLPSAAAANQVFWANLNGMDWLPALVEGRSPESATPDRHRVGASVEELIGQVLDQVSGPCHIVIMSNGGFGGIHQKLIAELERESG